MNERIDQLARAAGFKHPDHVGLCEEYAYFDHVRFAELIVQECIEHLESNVLVPNIEHSRTKAKCIRSIKQRFGVEK